MDRVRRRLSYANVVATLALVVAVAGGATAVAGGFRAPKNSVTSKSIKPNNVTARDLAGIIRVSSSSSFTDPAPPDGTVGHGNALASCPAGTRLISGGGGVNDARAYVTSSAAVGSGWSVAASADGTNTTTITADANCLANRVQKPSP